MVSLQSAIYIQFFQDSSETAHSKEVSFAKIPHNRYLYISIMKLRNKPHPTRILSQ